MNKGFTLIELIIVVAILGIVTAVAVPNYVNYLYQSRINTDIATARELARSAETYCGTYGLSSVPETFAWSETDGRQPVTASDGSNFEYSMEGSSVFVLFNASQKKTGKYSGIYTVSSYGDLPIPQNGGM
jgi:type IV pilus assembly protein PilA